MDMFFIYVRFKHDGVDIKLSPMGLYVGATAPGADLLSLDVCAIHTKRLGKLSPIIPTLLSVQILAHATAYVGCDLLPANGPCDKIKRHANPVNVSWAELGVPPGPGRRALDK